MHVRLRQEVQEVLRVEGLSRLQVGGFTLDLLSDGFFRLDGGAMYGVVPKSLWCRAEPETDDRNRVLLDLGCLLITTPKGTRVLVDTGLGGKYDGDARFTKMFAVERSRTLEHGLRELGLDESKIDVVTNTHLHFDHAGGNTVREDGRVRPAFSRARYVVQKAEWDCANKPHERNAASYLDENFAALADSKRFELIDGTVELEPGLKLVKTGGHSDGHQIVVIESEGQGAVYLGDLVPTRAHVPLPYIMGYDLYPMETLELKRSLYAQAQAKDWFLLFDHDKQRRYAKLGNDAGRWFAKEN